MPFPFPLLAVAAGGAALYAVTRPKETQAVSPLPPRQGRPLSFAPASAEIEVEEGPVTVTPERPQRRRPRGRGRRSIMDVPNVRAHIAKMRAEGASRQAIAAWVQNLKRNGALRQRLIRGAGLGGPAQLPLGWTRQSAGNYNKRAKGGKVRVWGDTGRRWWVDFMPAGKWGYKDALPLGGNFTTASAAMRAVEERGVPSFGKTPVGYCIARKMSHEGWAQNRAVAACLNMDREGRLGPRGGYHPDGVGAAHGGTMVMQEGFKAFRRGKTLASNPYDPDGWQSKWWRRGHAVAYAETAWAKDPGGRMTMPAMRGRLQ